MRPCGPGVLAVAVLLAGAPLAPSVAADPPTGAVYSMPIFAITKNQNRNFVQYAVRVDAHCTPTTTAPVFAYWRMIEKGPDRTESLLFLEQPAYGLSSQNLVTEGPDQGKILVKLRAFPSRPIVVDVHARPGGTCEAHATTPINGVAATLATIFVHVKWLVTVDYVDVFGQSLEGATPVSERLRR